MMKEDASNFVRACDRCQRFANYSSMPATLLTSMMSPWSFSMWGIDLIRDLPKGKGHVKYAVVAVDYLPNGPKLCQWQPLQQSNGQTEAINKIIKHTLKTKLEERNGSSPEELPKVLWSYNTTLRSTTGELSFMLTYGSTVMVPVEVSSGSLRRDRYMEEDSGVNQRLYLDLLEETRENSQFKLATYQQRVARYYNNKVKGQMLKVGDLVLRKVMLNTKISQHGVFGANWEGP
ncbi:uncharacterized protein LOC141673283 [Apium graveolens]|uniref:uncharacterized protein LOC141673283 n=1 Tax=Apium graveolens TaxID=4045 RepID=UPI003D79715D